MYNEIKLYKLININFKSLINIQTLWQKGVRIIFTQMNKENIYDICVIAGYF